MRDGRRGLERSVRFYFLSPSFSRAFCLVLGRVAGAGKVFLRMEFFRDVAAHVLGHSLHKR